MGCDFSRCSPTFSFACLAHVAFSKPKGIRAARKLKTHRQAQKWNDKQYNRAHLGTALKANPMGGTSHAKGIVLEKLYVPCLIPILWAI